MAKTLARYYTPKNLKRGNLVPYAFSVDGVRTDTGVASQAEWVGLSVKLGGNQERCRLVQEVSPTVQIPTQSVAHKMISIREAGTKVWNDPIYRLSNLALDTSGLVISFSLDEFFRYLFTVGLLHDEIIEALIAADFSVDKVISRGAALLPLRQQLLPNGLSLADFRSRMCAGGIGVLFAIARPKKNDFAILIERRSSTVVDAQGKICLIPEAFHQPMVGAPLEINPSFTVYREIYEELFEGKDAEEDVRHVKADWFFDKCEPVRWLRDHKDVCDLECTSFGIGLVSGNYTFGILLAVRDEEYWTRYSSSLVTNWEVARGFGEPFVSSKDPQQLAALLKEPEWDGESLFSFVEGLKRLKALEERRVDLPRIERVTL